MDSTVFTSRSVGLFQKTEKNKASQHSMLLNIEQVVLLSKAVEIKQVNEL